MKKVHIINRVVYLIFLLGFITCMVVGFSVGEFNKETNSDNKSVVSVIPDRKEPVNNSEVIYYIKLNGSAETNRALSFLSVHQNVEVYANGQRIYYIKGGDSVFGKTPGTSYNIVSIPSYTTDVTVKLKSVYDNIDINHVSFQYGDETTLVKSMITESLLSAAICWIIFIVGMVMVFVWLGSRKSIMHTEAMLYFGIYAMIVGCWSLNETNLALILVRNRTVASFTGYTLLMMMPIPFVQAEKFFFYMKKSLAANILCAVFAVTDIVLLVLHMTGICEFKLSVKVIHFMLAISLVYLTGLIIIRIRGKGFDRKVKANIVAVAALILSMIIDLIAYYSNFNQTDVVGKIGMLVCIITLAAESMSEAMEKVREGRKAEFYRDLAITDAMSAMYNRTAFDNWENSTKDYTDIGIVTFDLNNLKWCNDNLGHAEGDVYIETAADIIKNVFGRYGNCYRIGGDEFCTVIKHASRVDIEKCVHMLREEENRATKNNPQSPDIKIACGYAKFDADTDKDFEDTRSRADQKMYESKRELKRR